MKILKMPPRSAQEAMREMADEMGAQMQHFILVGLTKSDEVFCYTSSENLMHLGAFKVIIDKVISDSLDG